MNEEQKQKIINESVLQGETDKGIKNLQLTPNEISDNAMQAQTDENGDIRVVIKNWLAQLSALKLWAKPPLIETSNNRLNSLIERMMEEQDILDEILFVSEKKASLEGKVYVVVEPGTDTPVVRIAQNGYHKKVGLTITEATIFTVITEGQINYFMTEVYSSVNSETNQVVRSITTEGVNKKTGKKEQLNVPSDQWKQKTKLDIKPKETFNYDIPVIVLQNHNTIQGNGHSDTYGMESWLDTLQNISNRINFELKVNITRIFMNAAYASGDSLAAKQDIAMIKLKNQEVVVENNNMDSEDDSTSIIPGNLQLSPLLDTWTYFGNLIFETAGYKRNTDDKGSVQQNNLEIMLVRDSEITSFSRKERTRANFLKGIILAICDVDKNIKTRPETVVVNIQFLNIKDETIKLEQIEKRLNLGFITQVQAISESENITQKQAELMYAKIQQSQLEMKAFKDKLNPIATNNQEGEKGASEATETVDVKETETETEDKPKTGVISKLKSMFGGKKDGN